MHSSILLKFAKKKMKSLRRAWRTILSCTANNNKGRKAFDNQIKRIRKKKGSLDLLELFKHSPIIKFNFNS